MKSFTQLLDAYEQIAQHLPRFDRLAAVFHDTPEFQSILADVYVDILEFHSHAYKFLRRGGRCNEQC
jgi:predicted methyltransferase